MRCDQDQLGICPITEKCPADYSPRDGEAFAAAQAEIDKLTNIHAEDAVDWQQLSTLCADILKSEGKDLTVTIWLLCAWTRLRGLDGLSDGVHLLKDVLTLYWDNLTPPCSRMRARRNQAQWLIEWLDKTLAEPFEPMDATAAERLISDWDAVDMFWRSQDDQAPNFFQLRRRLEAISGVALVVPVQASPVATEPIAHESNISGPAVEAQPPFITPVVAVLDSDEAVHTSVEKVFESLGPVYAYCLEHCPSMPLAYRLNRQAAWITLEQLPPSQGRKTRLSPPPLIQRDSFLRLQEVGEPLDVVRFCEGHLSSFPFWLDLNRATYTALLQTGANAAAKALAHELQGLMTRLPGVTDLTFADGMPFADGATLSWLESLAPMTPAIAPRDRIEVCVDEARHMATEGRLNDGLAVLQRCITSTASERDRFRLSAAQCVLAHRFDPQPDLRLALEGMLMRADELKMEQWEPDLIKPLLEMMLDHSDLPEWPRRLSRLDFERFWCGRHKRNANSPKV